MGRKTFASSRAEPGKTAKASCHLTRYKKPQVRQNTEVENDPGSDG